MIIRYDPVEEAQITHRFYGDNSVRIVVLTDKHKILKKVEMETGILASSNTIKNITLSECYFSRMKKDRINQEQINGECSYAFEACDL